MIPNQRHLFDLYEDVAYLNCAYTSPLLRAALKNGMKAVSIKQNPWQITPKDFFTGMENARGLFARLIGADTDDVAIVPAASYGVALAAKNLPIGEHETIVVLADQFPSNIYSWRRLAGEKNAEIVTVPRPADSLWTPPLLEKINETVAVVAVPNCHWTDGTFIDLVKVGEKCRSAGAALVVDGTQSLGAMPFPTAAIQPDFLMTTSHKWLLGPYSHGFCYVAPKWRDGVPLEENWINRAGSENFAQLVNYRDDYQKGARRFDMGEASNFILTPIASAALEQLLDWGVENIALTLKEKTAGIANRAESMGLAVAPENARSPHMIGVSKPGGFSGELPEILAKEKVFVSVRGTSVRIAPHLYTTEEDIDRLFSALEKAM